MPQLFGQLKKGAIDIFKTDVVVVSMVGGGKGLAVLFAPYLFRDQDHFKKFCESPIFKGMMGELEKENGIKWIGLFGDRSPRGVSTRNKMVLVPDDLKGQKLRTPRVSIINKILTGWGASVAVVAVPELYSSLKQKVVDGQDNGIDAVDGFKLYEVQKYFTATDHVRSSEGLWMNQQKWDSLSPTHQEMIIEAAEVARAWVNEKLREKTFIWFDRVREHGMTIVMPPLKPWIDASGKVIEEFDGKAWPKGLYKKIQNIK